MKRLAAALLSAYLTVCWTASVQAQAVRAEDGATSPPAEVEVLAQELEESLIGPEGCAENLARLLELTAMPDFEVFLHPRRQSSLLVRAAMCLADEGKFDLALEYANRAAASDPKSSAAQGVRLPLGILGGKPRDSVDAFAALSYLRPEYVRSVDSYRIRELVDAANRSDPSGESALAVYDSMARAGWQPAAPEFDDSIRVQHARLLIERDRLDEARRRLERVTDLSSLVEMRVDRRFDPLRHDPVFAAQLDLNAGIERSIARAKEALDANPRSLAAVYQHAAALIEANRYAETLELLNSSMNRLREDPAAFKDRNLESAISNLVGAVQYETGGFDDGRAQFQDFIRALESDDFLASAQMTFAKYLVGEGRAQDALNVLASLGPVSPFGEAEAEACRVCARVQLNDASAADSLSYLALREAANEGALSRALLCIGDLDRLADLMVRRLRNPASRSTALLSLQVGPATVFDELPIMKTLAERAAALRAREDIRGAVEAIGRIETVPVRLSRLY